MTLNENRGLLLMVMCTVAVALALIGIIISARPLRLIILYHDIDGLKQDDPVVLRGVTIGKVEEIRPRSQAQTGVTVRIREDHASSLTHGTAFILRRGSILGLIGNSSIEVVTPSTRGTPFANGETVEGTLPPQSSLIGEGKRWTRESWKQLKLETGRLLEALQSSPYREEAEDILAQLGTLAEQGAQQARERLEDFQQAHQKDLQELIIRLERLGAEMRRRGDGAGAARIEKEVERVKGNP
jgi:ABC-type transporter Mla subunit MlaD